MNAKIPGIILCFSLALLATFIGQSLPLVGSPVTAIALGALLSLGWKLPDKLKPGVQFSAKTILQAAIVLLGFGLNLGVIVRTGWESLPIIIVTISASLVTAWLMHKLWRIDTKLATLIGVGSSICGGSAIAATAPVIEADHQEVAQAISVIFFYNLLAAIFFPILGGWLGFSTISGDGFGLFAGTAINDTSSVTAAATAWDNLHQLGTQTLDYSVTVKLTRTLFIIPITLGLGYLRSRHDRSAQAKPWYQHLPTFLMLFLGASIITSGLGLIDVTLPGVSQFKTLSKFFIVMAMAAIGLNTNVLQLIRSGKKPLILGLICWVIITLTSLMMQHLLKLW